MNRRAFLASLLAAPAAALALEAEPVCAWCKGTGRRHYSFWRPGFAHDPVRPLYIGPCDACRDRALWVPGKKLISVPAPPQMCLRYVKAWDVVTGTLIESLDAMLVGPGGPLTAPRAVDRSLVVTAANARHALAALRAHGIAPAVEPEALRALESMQHGQYWWNKTYHNIAPRW